MELTLQILVGLVTLICFMGGANLLLKGANSFLSEYAPPQPVLDNLFRFLSGIYFGLGFLMAFVFFHQNELHAVIYFVGIVVIFSGLGRLYSRINIGFAGKYSDSMMVLEIALGAAIMIINNLKG